jgi:hypothetical protein
MRSRLEARQESRSGSSSEEPSPPSAPAPSSSKKQRRQRTPSPHPNAGADTNKSDFYSCPPRVSCCCAHMIVEGYEAVSVMLDTGTLANFVDPSIADRYRAGAEVQPWSRRIRTGDKSLGNSSERIRLSITRDRIQPRRFQPSGSLFFPLVLI